MANQAESQAERTAMAKAWNVFVPPVREPAYLGTFEAGWAARADYGRGRERTLEDALKGMIAVTELPGTRSDLSPQTERAKSIARAALVASQPEGLSERSDTEPGEPGGQPKKAHNGIPDDYWREVPCGHPSDPIAVWSDDGYAICHCGWVLNPSEGFEIEGAPGPVVLCGKCGCHVAVPAQPVQPDHGPGEPSEEEGRFFVDRLLAEQFHATLPDPHRWRIRDLPTGGYLLMGESNEL